LTFKKAVSCRKIGEKCIVELMRKVIHATYIYSQTVNSIIHYFFVIFVPHIPTAHGTCKKLLYKKANIRVKS